MTSHNRSSEREKTSGRLALTVLTGTLIAAAAAGDAVAQTYGGFSGTVVDESGKPFAGVKIPYNRVQGMVMDTSHTVHRLVPAAGEPRAGGIAISSSSGAFGASGLPVGRYWICVSPPTDLHADPCVWNSGKVAFNVASGVTTSLKPIAIYAGVRLNFIITDAQRLLPASGSGLAPAAVVGVLTPTGAFQPATVVSRSAAVVQATITVPHNQPAQPWFFSRTLKFLDSSAKPLAMGPGAATTLPSGITDLNIALTVSK
jgi:hypothetical protein